MNKVYLVAFQSDINFNPNIFHQYIISLYPKFISDWWHHIGSVYLVATTLDVDSLYNLIYKGVPGRNLLIIEVDPNNNQGWLPKMAWDWINKYKR